MNISKLALIGVGAIAMAACKPAPQALAPAAKLPVSLNAVMATMVNHSADPIWIAAREAPKTDKEWRELERHAYQLEVSGALLVIPGTGPLDEQWTQRPEWQGFANSLSKAGAAAVNACKAKTWLSLRNPAMRSSTSAKAATRSLSPIYPQ